GIAGVANDGSDFNIVQLVAEGLHRGSGMAIKHREDLVFLGTKHGLGTTVQSGEGAGNALAVGLVAGYAVGGIHLRAASHQFVLRPFFVGIVRGGSQGFLLIGSPLFVVFLRNDVDYDRHECVILATEFGALAAVGTDFL